MASDGDMIEAVMDELGTSMPGWTAEQYEANINALFTGELAEAVEDVMDAKVANGSFVPYQKIAIDKKGDYIPEYPVGRTDQDTLNITRLYGIAVLSFMWENGNYRYFLDAILERRDSLPPVEGDLVVYRISREMFGEMYLSTNGMSMDFWEAMGQGRNPIYRQIAINGAMSSILPEYSKFHVLKSKSIDPRVRYWSAVQKIQFYRTFLNEIDPDMLACVYYALADSPHPESSSLTLSIILSSIALRSSFSRTTVLLNCSVRIARDSGCGESANA